MDVIIILLIALVFLLVRIRRNGRLQDNSIVRSEAYLRRCRSIHNNTIAADSHRLAGWKGEMTILQDIESLGMCIAFWNVGLNFRGRKTEFDVLAFSPFGILHVEVKEWSGSCSPANGEPTENPFYWLKRNTFTGAASMKRSPIAQALNARRILEDALKRICRQDIPVTSVVVFTNRNLDLRDIHDTRLMRFDRAGFKDFFRAFTSGQGGGTPLALVDMAKITACLGQAGQEPAFFDSRLMRKEDDNELSRAA